MARTGGLAGGRVKNLPPAVFSGILLDCSKADQIAEMEAQGIDPIDLVAVNFYPFEKYAGGGEANDADAVEMKQLLSFLKRQRQHYKTNPADTAKLLAIGLTPTNKVINQQELASWANLARIMFNLSETITRN